MKRSSIVLGALLVSSVAIGGSWRTMLSPGPLHSAHQAEEGNCDACHLSFAGIPNDKCLGCHEGLAARILANTGYHATLVGQECIACHQDHVGADGSQTKPEALKRFDHAKTGFSLEGSHSGVDCETCHEVPIHEMEGVCAQCHEDVHASALGPSCDSCHVPIGWEDELKTLSAHLLSMDGKHGKQECSDCHLHGANLVKDAPCSNCHEDAHGGTAAPCDQCHQVTGFKPAEFDHGPCTCAFPGKHQTVECLACHEDFQFTNTPIVCSGCHDDERPHDPIGECSACHTATSWSDNRFDHNQQTTFAIQGSHEAVACVQCHEGGQFRKAETDCAGCHAEAGLAAHGDFSSFGGCEACHETTPRTLDGAGGFAVSTFDHDKQTGFSLAGRHDSLNCQACHDGKVEGYPGEAP